MTSNFSPTLRSDIAAVKSSQNIISPHLTSNYAPSQPPTLPLCKKKSSSANHKQDPLITMQREALVPARNMAEKGSLTSDQLDKINAWRSAAATGALLENPHKSTPAGPSDGIEKISVAKGPSADCEWGDNLILL